MKRFVIGLAALMVLLVCSNSHAASTYYHKATGDSAILEFVTVNTDDMYLKEVRLKLPNLYVNYVAELG